LLVREKNAIVGKCNAFWSITLPWDLNVFWNKLCIWEIVCHHAKISSPHLPHYQ